MLPEQVIFVHGSGRHGVASWPEQRGFPDARFLILPGFGGRELPADAREQAISEIASLSGPHSVLIASSLGGVLAAAASARSAPGAVVLLEPALFSLSAEHPATRALLTRMEPVYTAPLGDDEFLRLFFLTLTGKASGANGEPNEVRARARRERAYGPPWSYDVETAWIKTVPTLVITGRWAQEYEEVARELVRLGAEHRVLHGYGHRVQDHPEMNAVITEFISGVM